MTERGLIYGRASRDPKATGTSVSKQIERGREWCAREGVTIVREVRDDDRSASRGAPARPGFEAARELINQGAADVLVLWEVSRSSRDTEEFAGLVNACADNNVEFVVSGVRYDPTDANEWLPLMLQGVMAEAEARRIKKRNQDSVDTNAQRRTPHGRIPYGYRRVYDPATGVLLNQTPFSLIDPERLTDEAQVLSKATERLLSGVTLRQVCRDLNSFGIPTPRKPRKSTVEENPAAIVTRWEPQTLRQLLLNPTIAGRRVHRGEDIGEAAWEPIVPYDTWLRLRSLLMDPGRVSNPAPRGPAPRHLLSGIARCGECNALMKAATNLSRMPVAYVCRAEGCMKVTVSGARVDEVVNSFLGHYFARPEFRAALTAAYAKQRSVSREDTGATEKIAEVEAELAEVENLRASGDMSLRAYANETKRLEERLDQLRVVEIRPVTSPAVRRLLRAESLRDGWRSADLIDRREIVRSLLSVTIRRATTRGRRFDPTRVAIEPGLLLLGSQVEA